jgi:tetratricopeptide (TPR) repeat protein
MQPFDESLPRAADHALWFELADRGEFRAYPLALSMIRRHAGNREDPERTRAVWDASRQTIGRAIARWSLEEFYPEIDEATDEGERGEIRVLARLERAGHLIRVGLLGEALADVDAGLAERATDARLLHFRAVVLLESGRLDEAKVAFEEAARAGAPAVEVACGLGTIAYWQGDLGRARTAFRRARAADPRSLLARYNLALIEESPESARVLARDALSLVRLPGFLLSPEPPLEGVEAELVRLRRGARNAPSRLG